MIYFTSDLHFGHQNVILFDNRPYSCLDEMNDELIKNWNNTVSDEDTIYVLGDMFNKCNLKMMEIILQQLKGNIILVKGNHDNDKDLTKLKKYFKKIVNYFELDYKDKKFILSHYPIPFYNKMYNNNTYMLYGHVHNTIEENYVQKIAQFINEQDRPCKMINVGCMHWGFKPVSIESIINLEKGE